jgi:hypothetical protein
MGTRGEEEEGCENYSCRQGGLVEEWAGVVGVISLTGGGVLNHFECLDLSYS